MRLNDNYKSYSSAEWCLLLASKSIFQPHVTLTFGPEL